MVGLIEHCDCGLFAFPFPVLGVNSPLLWMFEAEVVAWVGVVKVRACKGEFGALLKYSMLRGVRDVFDWNVVDRDSASMCAFLCDSKATSWATVLGVEELDVVGLRSIAFFFGEAEREDDQDGMTAVASLEEPALLKEYEGLLMLTLRVFDLGGGAKFSGLFKDWNCCSWVESARASWYPTVSTFVAGVPWVTSSIRRTHQLCVSQQSLIVKIR